LWKVSNGKLSKALKDIHSDTILDLEFSPDGRFLGSSGADRFLRVTSLASGKVAKSFEGHTHHVLGLGWKADGRTLVTAGADNVVKVWDFVTGERKKNIEGFSKEVTSVRFLGVTDQFLASSGDSKVRLLRENGGEVRSYAGAADFVYASAVSSDGKIAIAGGADGILKVWNVNDGKTLATFEPPK
jgi:WD40 repeat protein